MTIGLAAHELGVGIGHSTNPKAGMKPKEANYSPYMRSLMAATHGETVNPCPFGCDDDELDQHGRCFHRVGVSPDGKHIEHEVVREDGMLVMRPQYSVVVVNGKKRRVLPKVDKKKHVLIQVTTSFLVYEDRPCPPDWAKLRGLDDTEPPAAEDDELEGSDDTDETEDFGE